MSQSVPLCSTSARPRQQLPPLDSPANLCYHLSVKGCDEDTRKGKIPREGAIR